MKALFESLPQVRNSSPRDVLRTLFKSCPVLSEEGASHNHCKVGNETPSMHYKPQKFNRKNSSEVYEACTRTQDSSIKRGALKRRQL